VSTEKAFGNDSGGGAKDRLPVNVVNKLMRVQRRLLHELKREPTTEEMAQRVDLSAERLRELLYIIENKVPLGEEDDFLREPGRGS
jgi:DNA-directed RNA polymerase sigma subunit (sigma70/sigma32)